MGFLFGGTQANVTITGGVGLGTPNSNQTIIQKGSGKSPVAITAGTGLKLYDVTAGKTLYVTSIAIGDSINNNFDIRDGTIAGTIIQTFRLVSGVCTNGVLNFPTPLKFNTAVFIDSGANSSINWTFSGWEE